MRIRLLQNVARGHYMLYAGKEADIPDDAAESLIRAKLAVRVEEVKTATLEGGEAAVKKRRGPGRPRKNAE